MSKFQKGDRVRFKATDHMTRNWPQHVGKEVTVADPNFLSHYVRVEMPADNYYTTPWLGSWYEDDFELVCGQPGANATTSMLPDCPGCGKTAAPEHVANGKARCWWCERRWDVPQAAAPAIDPYGAMLKSGAAIAAVRRPPLAGFEEWLPAGNSFGIDPSLPAVGRLGPFTPAMREEMDRLLEAIDAGLLGLFTPRVLLDLPDLEDE